jgi:hypothetical protein
VLDNGTGSVTVSQISVLYVSHSDSETPVLIGATGNSTAHLLLHLLLLLLDRRPWMWQLLTNVVAVDDLCVLSC